MRSGRKGLAGDKHSSLLYLSIIGKEKRFITSTLGGQYTKIFSMVIKVNKVGHCVTSTLVFHLQANPFKAVLHYGDCRSKLVHFEAQKIFSMLKKP